MAAVDIPVVGPAAGIAVAALGSVVGLAAVSTAAGFGSHQCIFPPLCYPEPAYLDSWLEHSAWPVLQPMKQMDRAAYTRHRHCFAG